MSRNAPQWRSSWNLCSRNTIPVRQ